MGVLSFIKQFLSRAKGTDLVLESSEGFNRSIYHVHHELEFTMPYEDTFAVLNRFVALYERQYAAGRPFVVFKLRFTPSGHDPTLIGAGRERRSTWIDLLCNDSTGHEAFFESAEQLVKEIGGRPHLGKYCRSIDRSYLQQVHGEHFALFRRLVQEHDPDGRFVNAFTQKLFEPETG